MRELTIESFNSYQYREVHEITVWKDGYVWKTKVIGFIHREDKHLYPSDKYALTSISTHLTRGPHCTLHPYLET